MSGHHLMSNVKSSSKPVVYMMNSTTLLNFNTICSKLQQSKIVLLDWANPFKKCIFNQKRVHTLPVRWQRSTHSRLCRLMEAVWGTSVFPVMGAHEDGGDKDPGAPTPLELEPSVLPPRPHRNCRDCTHCLFGATGPNRKQTGLSQHPDREKSPVPRHLIWSDPLHTHKARDEPGPPPLIGAPQRPIRAEGKRASVQQTHSGSCELQFITSNLLLNRKCVSIPSPAVPLILLIRAALREIVSMWLK